MNNKIKFLLILLFTIINFSFFSENIFAETATSQEWKAKNDVDPYHNFKISFSNKVDEKTVKGEHITVKQVSSQKFEEITFTVSDNKKSIIVHAPKNGYIEGETYILSIGKGILSTKGIALKKDILFKFKVKPPLIEQFVKVKINEEYDRDELNRIISRISLIPQKYLKGLVENGEEIRIINYPLTDEPEYEHLRGEIPRGWEFTGKTWEDVPGVGGNPVIVKIGYSDFGNDHGTLNLEMHEIAHRVDISLFNSISYTEEFMNIVNSEMHNLIKDHPNSENMYYFEYPDEYFAEAFSYYYLNDELRAELKLKAPLTYDFFFNLEYNY